MSPEPIDFKQIRDQLISAGLVEVETWGSFPSTSIPEAALLRVLRLVQRRSTLLAASRAFQPALWLAGQPPVTWPLLHSRLKYYEALALDCSCYHQCAVACSGRDRGPGFATDVRPQAFGRTPPGKSREMIPSPSQPVRMIQNWCYLNHGSRISTRTETD